MSPCRRIPESAGDDEGRDREQPGNAKASGRIARPGLPNPKVLTSGRPKRLGGDDYPRYRFSAPHLGPTAIPYCVHALRRRCVGPQRAFVFQLRVFLANRMGLFRLRQAVCETQQEWCGRRRSRLRGRAPPLMRGPAVSYAAATATLRNLARLRQAAPGWRVPGHLLVERLRQRNRCVIPQVVGRRCW